MASARLAKYIMSKFEVHPTFCEDDVGGRNEVFNHNSFLHGSELQQRSIMQKSSECKYMDEIRFPWDNYFGFSLSPLLEGETVLDLGCFTGGRSVAWFERYRLRQISGVDIKEVYIEAAKQFGNLHNASTDFRVGYGESLPYEDETFDAILTFDVFEHVKDIQRTLSECYRVLKAGGRLLAVFPSYF